MKSTLQQKFKIPKGIYWNITTGFFLLLVMSVLRLALVIAFRLSNDFIPHFWAIFLLGVRYDTRMVCISLLVIFLLGTLPVLDPFKNKWGKKISFILWSVLLIIFIIFYTVDFAN
jgi:Na+/melibiose symporter-like transporter